MGFVWVHAWAYNEPARAHGQVLQRIERFGTARNPSVLNVAYAFHIGQLNWAQVPDLSGILSSLSCTLRRSLQPQLVLQSTDDGYWLLGEPSSQIL